MHDYYKKGYIRSDAATSTDSWPLENPNWFVRKELYQPYAESIWSRSAGYEIATRPLHEPYVFNNSVTGSMQAISKISKNPERAMMFLNLLNSDPYLRNLLDKGIEGVHYEGNEDGTIKDLDARVERYNMPSFAIGNQLILDRFLPRIKSKIDDRRHGFLFNLDNEKLKSDYLMKLVNDFMEPSSNSNSGVKIIDFSEVPSDILPIVISLVAKIVFQIQQWTPSESRFPISLLCDEAHLYLPSKQLANASEIRALSHFERIAKEGRKYGVSLTIISQRPAELNTTIMSQCNNVIALRLSNQSDKNVVSNLLPENLGGIKEILPTLGIGECIVVGDACLLPSRIKIEQPEYKPKSNSLKFWSIWKDGEVNQNLNQSVINLQRQTFE